jgi:tetratricopeptide (TPR) repeat protein
MMARHQILLLASASWIMVCGITLIGGGRLFAQAVPANFDEAKQTLRNGDYPMAEAEFRTLLAANPSSPEILDDLGIALQLQGKSDEAMSVFEKVLQSKRFPDAVALLAVDFCRNHEFDRAAPLLKEAKGDLDDPNIMATVGPCFLEAGQPEQAVFIYQKLVGLGTPPADENAVNLVRAYFDLSRKVLESLASLPQGLIYARAVNDAKRGGAPDAKSLFPKAYQDAPYLKPSMNLDELIRLLGPHPRDPSLLYILGVQCAEQAAQEFDSVQDKWPDSIALSQLIAELKDAQGDRDGAIQTYEQTLAAHPDAPASVHFALGLLYAERNMWEQALHQYSFIGADSAGSLYLKQRMSEALLHSGRTPAVIDLLSKIVAQMDAPFWALRDYGEAAERLDQKQRAVKYLKRASVLEPRDASIHYRLFDVYRKLNQPDAAAHELQIFRQLKTGPRPPLNP